MNLSKPNRRAFFRAGGAVVAFPWLESLGNEQAASGSSPRRMIAIMTDLGMIPEDFFPTQSGSQYEPTRYLQTLDQHRHRFSVFSGMSHPEVTGGHQTDVCFLTGAPHPRKPGFKNSISLDQFAAQSLGPATRYPTLTLRIGPSNKTLAYSADGVALPSEHRPSQIFQQLFVQGTRAEVEAQVGRLRDGQSLMDRFAEQIQLLSRTVSAEDRRRLDQYLSSVREVERRLAANEEWAQTPKPDVDARQPKDNLDPAALVERTRLIYDLSRLAIETDSTRLITIFVTQQFNPKVDLPGVDIPHHALTHQMSQPKSREQLQIVETAQMKELGRLLDGLASVKEAGNDLLDRTMVLYGSNLGNAARHDTTNLPILLAGGGFRHGSHHPFDAQRNLPLANLFVSMLQNLGVETDRFSTSTGSLSHLLS